MALTSIHFYRIEIINSGPLGTPVYCLKLGGGGLKLGGGGLWSPHDKLKQHS